MVVKKICWIFFRCEIYSHARSTPTLFMTITLISDTITKLAGWINLIRHKSELHRSTINKIIYRNISSHCCIYEWKKYRSLTHKLTSCKHRVKIHQAFSFIVFQVSEERCIDKSWIKACKTQHVDQKHLDCIIFLHNFDIISLEIALTR